MFSRTLAAFVGGFLLVAGMGATAVASGLEAMPAKSMAGMTGPTHWRAVGGGTFHSNGSTRTYYIQAEIVAWNYAPTGRNQITGKPFDSVGSVYTKTGPNRIGST